MENHAIQCLDVLEAELVRVLYNRHDLDRMGKVRSVLERYSGVDWLNHQRCPKFDGYNATGYQRVCVKKHNDLFDLLILTWAPHTKSAIHSHPCERCFLMCVSGSMYEERYQLDKTTSKPVLETTTPIPPRVATWISDDMGLHCVGNSGDGVACSLHCYIPGFTTPCTLYDSTSGLSSTVSLLPKASLDLPLANAVISRLGRFIEEGGTDDKEPSFMHKAAVGQTDIESAFQRARCPLKFSPNAQPIDGDAMLAAVDLTTMFSIHTNHRFFFNQLLTKPDAFAAATDSLATFMNINMYHYENAPVLTLIERYMLEHLARQLGWSEFDGIFLPGASVGNLTAMHAARECLYPVGTNRDKDLVVFTSEESHQSLAKAAKILGLSACVYVPCDPDTGCVLVASMERALQDAVAGGKTPFFINCTSGSTHSGAFDDCEGLFRLAKKYSCWLHVDGALGASFLLPKEEPFATLTRGIPSAHSISWNLHKIGGLPVPCSVLLCSRSGVLSQAHDVGDSKDIANESIMSSRRADAFKAWALWKRVGDTGMANRVRLVYMHNLDLARMIRDYPRRISRDNPTIPNCVDEPESVNVGAFQLAYEPTSACTCFYWLPGSLRAEFKEKGPAAMEEELGIVARAMKHKLIAEGSVIMSHFSTKSRPHFWRIPVIHQSVSLDNMWNILKFINRIGSELFPNSDAVFRISKERQHISHLCNTCDNQSPRQAA